MALRSLKECKVTGCHELTREANGYCKDHQAIAFKRTNITKFDKFYLCNDWRVKRDKIRARDNHTCIMCLMLDNNPINEAEVVHHIEELMQAWNKRLDSSNLISLCKQCHKIVHDEYKNGNKQEMQQRLKSFLKKSKEILR